MRKIVHQVQIQAKHRYGFRSGEWASLMGCVMVQPEGEEFRLCYFVAFPDGVTDYWPVSEDYKLAVRTDER